MGRIGKKKGINPLEGVVPAPKRWKHGPKATQRIKKEKAPATLPIPIRTETPEMVNAFEYYYNMGQDRTYTKVAAYMHRSSSTIMKWSNDFGWWDRINQRGEKTRQFGLVKHGEGEVSTPEELRKELKDMRSKVRSALDEVFIEDRGKLRLKVNVEEVKDIGTLFRVYKDIVEMDIRAQSIKQQSTEVQKLEALRNEIKAYMVGTEQGERIKFLRKMNEKLDQPPERGIEEAEVVIPASLSQFVDGDVIIDLDTEGGDD